MAVRAVRGATQLEDDVREHMLERVAEMVLDVMTANGLEVDDFISVIFTATSDLVSEFPAYAARRLGFGSRTWRPTCPARTSPMCTYTVRPPCAAT